MRSEAEARVEKRSGDQMPNEPREKKRTQRVEKERKMFLTSALVKNTLELTLCIFRIIHEIDRTDSISRAIKQRQKQLQALKYKKREAFFPST